MNAADVRLIHEIDQEAADIRDYAASIHLNLHDPVIQRTVKLVTDWVLVAGLMAEPDSERVAAAMFLEASAWREVCAK